MSKQVSPHLGPSVPAPPRLWVLTMKPQWELGRPPCSPVPEHSLPTFSPQQVFLRVSMGIFQGFLNTINLFLETTVFFLTRNYLCWRDFSFEMPVGVLNDHWCKWDLNVKKFALKAANFRRGRHLFYIPRNICFQHQRIYTHAYSSWKDSPES